MVYKIKLTNNSNAFDGDLYRKGSKIQRILHNLIFSDLQNSLNFAGKYTTVFELST
jgi:hypothetical protein